MIVFRCHACGAQVSAAHGMGGEAIDCPACGVALRVPGADDAPMAQRQARCTRLVYVLVGVFLGVYGVHNFLAGYIRRGIVQLSLTAGAMLIAFVCFGIVFLLTATGAGSGSVPTAGVGFGLFGCVFAPIWLVTMGVWIWVIVEIITTTHDADGAPMRW
jgi:TM2 domain-containing membrane protein YozV